MSAAPTRPAWVDFHFDLMCPYAFQASLWIREVRERTGLIVNWRFFSLEEINRAEGKKHPWERTWSYGWSLMRIGALLRRQGMDLLDDWYATAGRALHADGEKPHQPEVARDLLARMGLDPGLVDAAIEDPTTGDEVLAEHERVAAAGGFGVPTLFFPGGQCLFGPVLTTRRRARRPSGCGTRWSPGPSSRTYMRSSDPRPGATRSRSPKRSALTCGRGTGSASTAAPSSTSPSRRARKDECHDRA